MLSHSVMSNSLRPHGLYPSRLLCPWSGQNTGLIFPPPRGLPDLGWWWQGSSWPEVNVKLVSSESATLAGGFFTTVPYGKPPCYTWSLVKRPRSDVSFSNSWIQNIFTVVSWIAFNIFDVLFLCVVSVLCWLIVNIHKYKGFLLLFPIMLLHLLFLCMCGIFRVFCKEKSYYL